MLFAIGTKVKFLHSGDEGVIRTRFPDGMLSVYLPADDMEIPAAEEDLIRAEERGPVKVKAKIIAGKKDIEPPKAPPMTVETQYTVLKSLGIQLVFLLELDAQGLPLKYRFYLLNDTSYNVVYEIKFWLDYRTENWNGMLPATAYLELGEMQYDDLNEAPEFEVKCQWVTTEGLSEPVHKLLKIKAKTFFSSLKTAPFLNKPTHLYKLFERPAIAEGKPEEDLRSYTKSHSKPVWKRDLDKKVFEFYSAEEVANFETELDLHIEKLVDNWRRLPKTDILRIQIAEFEKYLEKAKLMGVETVFVIHGLGEGRLKSEIATRLMQNPDVQSFKNEYHPKYGWGATEVIF